MDPHDIKKDSCFSYAASYGKICLTFSISYITICRCHYVIHVVYCIITICLPGQVIISTFGRLAVYPCVLKKLDAQNFKNSGYFVVTFLATNFFLLRLCFFVFPHKQAHLVGR